MDVTADRWPTSWLDAAACAVTVTAGNSHYSEDLAIASAVLAALAGEGALRVSGDERLVRTALELIGTECVNYARGGTCVSAIVATGDVNAKERTYGVRTPSAPYSAERWCDQCIARTALEGGEFPPRGSDLNIATAERPRKVEEVPDAE